MKFLYVRKLRFIFIFYLCLLVFAEISASASQTRLKFDYVADLGVETRQAFLQDNDGFLWIGTSGGGLFKYDGYELHNYGIGPDLLISGDIAKIIQDRENPDILWLATLEGGFSRFDKATETFTHYTYSPDRPAGLAFSSVSDILQDGKDPNLLWIVGDQMLQTFDITTETFSSNKLAGDASFLPESREFFRIIEDRRDPDILWLAGFGLARFKKTTETFRLYLHDSNNPDSLGFETNYIGSIVQDKNDPDLFWLGYWDGPILDQFDTRTETFSHYTHDPQDPQSLRKGSIQLLYDDGKGTLWLGGWSDSNGLTAFKKSAETFTTYTRRSDDSRSLSTDMIVNVARDRAGILWIIHMSGKIDKYDPYTQHVVLYQSSPNSANSLIDSAVYSIYEDHDNLLWFGTTRGLSRLDRTTGTFKNFISSEQNPDSPDSEYILCTYEDSSGNFWIGLYGAPLAKFDKTTGKVLDRVSLPEGSGGVAEIIGDPRDHDILWLGLVYTGFAKFHIPSQRIIRHYPPYSEQPEKGVAYPDVTEALHDNHEESIWLSSWGGGGLTKFEKTTELFTQYSANPADPESLSYNSIGSLYQNDEGTLWIGTRGGGLNKFHKDTDTFTRYGRKHGVPPMVNGILEDDHGKLWLSTNVGIVRFDPKSERVDKTYRQGDGLQGNTFLYESAVKTHDGAMWFGGTNGVNRLHPDELRTNPYLPPVVLTSLTQGGEKTRWQGRTIPTRLSEITLLWKKNFFEFTYAALNYTAPGKNQYKYILEGLDQEWYYAGNKRTGRYSGLPPGTYILRVAGSNNDGIWSDQEAALDIIVLPPWWRTWWAYMLYVLSVGGMIFAYVRYRTLAQQRALEQKQKELEQERVVNERLQRLDKLKDEFLANTSHELRTPLNGIIGLAESLIDGATGTLAIQTRQNLGMIVSSGKRLTNLVNDILDFSKLKQHELALQKKPMNMQVVADVVLTLSKPLIGHKDLQLRNDISADLPAVMVDKNRVQQIMHNLVGNAIKFTESGNVTVSADLAKNRNMMAISVSDTGIGIPTERQGRIFESFEQADGATAREYGGTGLGLSVTKQLVELHDGEIWVESSVGSGSRFTFTLPLTDQAVEGETIEEHIPSIDLGNEENEAAEGVIIPTISIEGRFNILIVDDEPVNLQVLTNHLSLQNYHVVQALNGLEAFASIEAFRNNNQQFDLIILDIMMPKISGYEVSRKLREVYPPYELPIVMLTAKNQVNDLVTGFNSGANDYLTKPFSKEELLTRVKTHLQLAKTNISYSRFVPHEYLKFLSKDSIIDVNLGDHVAKEMAVMFSDIRSFTTISETMSSQENFNFVNAYLRRVSPVIRDNNGFIVKFLGDGMMAVFPNGVDDALRAGVMKLKQVEQYNLHRQQDGWQSIHVGIGIHVGHMMVGMVGETNRMQGDAFSDNVNLTSRLEGLTKYYGSSCIISGETLDHLSHPEQYQLRFLDKVIVKGRTEPIEVYEVLDGEPEDIMKLKLKTFSNFDKGIAHYQHRQFAEAGTHFCEVLNVHPNDKAAKLYLERINTLLNDGIPDDWDCITCMTAK